MASTSTSEKLRNHQSLRFKLEVINHYKNLPTPSKTRLLIREEVVLLLLEKLHLKKKKLKYYLGFKSDEKPKWL